MARPKADGTPAAPVRRKHFTQLFCRKARGEQQPVNYWDKRERGLVLRIQPSGSRAFKFVYSVRGRPRWYHIGNIPLGEARKIAAKVRLDVVHGRDPVVERAAQRLEPQSTHSRL